MTASVRAAYAGFAAFGALWGVWGALLPSVREQAGLSHGQLGTALLFIGAGALPAMLLTGPAVDRWEHRVTALLQVALGGTGVVVAVTGHGFVSLCVGLGLLGAVSGAADVANNAAAASAEQASGHPVIARAHGVFSASVVVTSLIGGALRGVDAAVAVPFLLATAAGGAAGLITLAATRTFAAAGVRGLQPAPRPRTRRRPLSTLRLLPLLVAGGLVALAFAVENAHQSWSAVYLGDVLSAGPAVAAAGPAVFAGVVALARFAVATLTHRHALAVLIAGALTAALGTAVVAAAANVAIALTGLGLAAAGTAVLQPTVLGLVARRVDETARGRATAVVTTVAYLGFLAGPVYVGQWAGAVGLPGAMLAVAAVAVVLALLTWPAVRLITRTPAAEVEPVGRR
ncbi:MFS transporter [Jiangella ureilytica]|uniref:MFS transporter n=1 Tax=Jiangella ureilytica TaxID=2530374 RepID=UPI00193D011F|nr:MFS transporter [Jiangella ureilytica]